MKKCGSLFDSGSRWRLAGLLSDTRGAAMVEYAVLIGAVAITGSLGLILVGAAVAENFEFVRGLLLCPIP